MSTRSIVARPVAIDPLPRPDAPIGRGLLDRLFSVRPRARFQGVYHHNGGPPDEMGDLLWNLMTHRYAGDARRLWKELLADNPAGWSSLFCFQDPDVCRSWDGKTKLTVEARQAEFEGNGNATAPVSFQGDPQRDLGFRVPPIREWSDKMWAEWVYVVGLTELVVFEVGEDGVSVKEAARFPWTPERPDWAAAWPQTDGDGDDEDGDDGDDED